MKLFCGVADRHPEAEPGQAPAPLPSPLASNAHGAQGTASAQRSEGPEAAIQRFCLLASQPEPKASSAGPPAADSLPVRLNPEDAIARFCAAAAASIEQPKAPALASSRPAAPAPAPPPKPVGPEETMKLFCGVADRHPEAEPGQAPAPLPSPLASHAHGAQDGSCEASGDVVIKGSACPECSRPLKWSAFGEGAYAHGWTCENAQRCGGRGTKDNTKRWFCAQWHRDFCEACVRSPEVQA